MKKFLTLIGLLAVATGLQAQDSSSTNTVTVTTDVRVRSVTVRRTETNTVAYAQVEFIKRSATETNRVIRNVQLDLGTIPGRAAFLNGCVTNALSKVQ